MIQQMRTNTDHDSMFLRSLRRQDEDCQRSLESKFACERRQARKGRSMQLICRNSRLTGGPGLCRIQLCGRGGL